MDTVTIHSDFGTQENKICHCFHFLLYVCHEVMGPDAMILVYSCWALSQVFHFPLLPSSRGSLVPLHFLPIGYYHLHIWGCWYFSLSILIPAWASSNLAFCMMCSSYKLNKLDDHIQPCCTPFPILNQSVVPRPVLTVASWPAYRFLRREVRWSDIPRSLRIFHSLLWSTQSKALAQSVKQK